MKYLTDYISSNNIEGYVVVESNNILKAQKLSFNGTNASFEGQPEEILNIKIFETGINQPTYNSNENDINSGLTEYYKCVSINVSNKTWCGSKVIIDTKTGVWCFSEEITTELLYNKIIPQIGKVYDKKCTFIISGFDRGLLIPQDDLIFYAPLNGNYKDIVQQLQPIYTDGKFVVFDDKTCLYGNGVDNSLVKWTCPSNISNTACSIFGLFVYVENTDWDFLFGYGTTSNDYQMMYLKVEYDKFAGRLGGADWHTEIYLTPNTWYSAALTRDETGNCVLYYNGKAVKTGIVNFTLGKNEIRIGSDMRGSHGTPNTYYRDCCIYNRVLTAEEVLQMHNNLIS